MVYLHSFHDRYFDSHCIYTTAYNIYGLHITIYYMDVCVCARMFVYVCVCFSDRFRTTINVLGDSLGAGIIDHLSRGELADMDSAPEVITASKSGECAENGVEVTQM